jgi:hypothetical protein
MFYKEKAQHCPGEVCDVKSKQDIQKTSKAQMMIVLVFVVYVFLVSLLFNDIYNKKPFEMFGGTNSTQAK